MKYNIFQHVECIIKASWLKSVIMILVSKFSLIIWRAIIFINASEDAVKSPHGHINPQFVKIQSSPPEPSVV